MHSRPQSPSFLGHVVGIKPLVVLTGGRLQIKPSGSGDENDLNGKRDRKCSTWRMRRRFAAVF